MLVSRRRRRRSEGPRPRTRWQPRRRCKRYRWREGDPHLLELPLEILRELLTFTMPEKPQERWLWMSRVGGTCPIFRALTQEEVVVLGSFQMDEAFLLADQDPAAFPDRIPLQLQAPFLQSFLDAPWKGARLGEFDVTVRDPATADLVRAVLTTPGILPNLDSLWIDSQLSGFINAEVLNDLARNLPKLDTLFLKETPRGGHVTVEEFGMFGSLLQQPLEGIILVELSWMTDAHIVRLVQAQIDRFGSPRLETLILNSTRVTPAGLRSVLEMARGTLEELIVERSREELMDEALDLSEEPALQGTREDWNALARDFPDVEFS